jgi:hypothetical protein
MENIYDGKINDLTSNITTSSLELIRYKQLKICREFIEDISKNKINIEQIHPISKMIKDNVIDLQIFDE